MYIKGSKDGNCRLCQYGHHDTENNIFMCMLKNEETEKDDTCKKFKYDIYKYKPKKKMLFDKFKKEDFEL